jgi:hypothetical protein
MLENIYKDYGIEFLADIGLSVKNSICEHRGLETTPKNPPKNRLWN